MLALKDLTLFLQCPKCGHANLSLSGSSLKCTHCGSVYRIVQGIPDLRVGFYGCRPTLWKLFYDAYGRFYDILEDAFASKVGFSEKLLRLEIVKAMELEGNNVVLEICTGTCRNLAYFSKLVDGTYIGLDASPGMLRQCFKNLEENARVGLVLGFAENLPFKDEIFDRVLIGGCLGHIALKKRALEEACRVLKPGKTLIVYDQTTYLDRISGKVYKTLENRPSELVLKSFRYLFRRHIYTAKFTKVIS